MSSYGRLLVDGSTIGQRVGDLVQYGPKFSVRMEKRREKYAVYQGVCGSLQLMQVRSLKEGRRQCRECGFKKISSANKKHGWHGTPEYSSWRAMVDRCVNPHSSSYPYYGARGVRVARVWTGERGCAAFVSHIGPRPSMAHTIDRIDNSRGYEPGNVRWNTPTGQCRNRTNNRLLTANGETHCIAEWAEILKVDPSTVQKRLKSGRFMELVDARL